MVFSNQLQSIPRQSAANVRGSVALPAPPQSIEKLLREFANLADSRTELGEPTPSEIMKMPVGVQKFQKISTSRESAGFRRVSHSAPNNLEVHQIVSRFSVSPFSARPQRICALIEGETVEFSTIEEKFDKLARVWESYNYGKSVVRYDHAAYLQIIGMGWTIVPRLLRELKNGAGDWLLALRYITGANVTTPDMRGNFPAIRQAWIRWGEENGLG